MGYRYRSQPQSLTLNPTEKAKLTIVARARAEGALQAQAKIKELNERATTAEENLAKAHTEIRALKVKAEQVSFTQLLQEKIDSLEEERDALIGTIEALKLSHQAEIKNIRSQKTVRAGKDANTIKKLETKLASASFESAAITITDSGIELHGAWANAPKEILKQHIKQAAQLLIAGGTNKHLTRSLN